MVFGSVGHIEAKRETDPGREPRLGQPGRGKGSRWPVEFVVDLAARGQSARRWLLGRVIARASPPQPRHIDRMN